MRRVSVIKAALRLDRSSDDRRSVFSRADPVAARLLGSLLPRSAGECPTSERLFDSVCVRCVGSQLFPQEARPVWCAGPWRLLPPPLSPPCVSPALQPACTPDRQTDAISRASPALGLYHSPQTAPLLPHRLQIFVCLSASR